MKECVFQPRESYLSTVTERNSVLVLIIWGYFLLLSLTFALCFFTAFYFGYKQYIKPDLENVANKEEAETKKGGIERMFTKMIDNNSAPTLVTGLTAMRTRRFENASEPLIS